MKLDPSQAAGRALSGLALLALPLVAHAQSDAPDNFKGLWMNYEVGTLEPFAFSSAGDEVYVANQPGSRVFHFPSGAFEVRDEVPVGPGTASIGFRPGSDELWIVDRVTSTVAILDTTTGQVLETIEVGAEPHGLAFTADGDRGYVSCSAAGQVDVIDASTRTVVKSHPIPSRAPRGMALLGDHVYVAPLLSGNGSTTRGNTSNGRTDTAVEIHFPELFPGTRPLPDRDLFGIQVTGVPSTSFVDASHTVRKLGTVLYDVTARPGSSELWIPNTEALNVPFRGEKAFLNGQVAQNRISIVDVSLLGQGNNNAAISIIDLDTLIPVEHHASTPTDVAFSADGTRAFVAGYGSDTIAVLSAAAGPVTWLGSIHITPAGSYPDGAGPRNLAVSPDDQFLYVHTKGESGMVRIPLAALPTTPGFSYTTHVGQSRALGWDPLPGDINQGRVHFNRTQNSLTNSSSCMSCHVDGHVDGVVWDLSGYLDPEGVAPSAMAFPIDNKGPLVTQSVRHLKEVGPYHWRGEKKKLVKFNRTFVDLMQREENGASKDLGNNFRYITQYMETLAIGPNPRQAFDRSLTAEEEAGRNLFLFRPVLGGLTCNDCHTLPLGTRGEIVDNQSNGLAPSGVVPSLREVADKESTPYTVGGPFGERTEAGIGYGHNGVQPDLEAILFAHLESASPGQPQALTSVEIAKLEAFLKVFDTGHAPAAAHQATATAANHLAFESETLGPWMQRAQAGDCDLVYRYGPIQWHGLSLYMTGRYDPPSGKFLQAAANLPQLDPSDLMAVAASGQPVTFLGVPPFMGEPMALDRDNDGVFDLDELLIGTDPENTDTDEDGYFDGYERKWNMDPLVHNATSPDQDAPQIVGGFQVIYETTNAIKFEFHTNEPARALFSYNGGGPVLRAPLKPKHGKHFSVVLSELEPNSPYDIEVHLTDLEGNVSTPHLVAHTLPFVQPHPAFVSSFELGLIQAAGGASGADVRARVTMELDSGVPAAGYDLEGIAYYVADDDSQHVDLGVHRKTTGPAGRAGFRITIPANIPQGQGHIYFAVKAVRAPGGSPIYAEGDDVEPFSKLPY